MYQLALIFVAQVVQILKSQIGRTSAKAKCCNGEERAQKNERLRQRTRVERKISCNCIWISGFRDSDSDQTRFNYCDDRC